MLLPSVISIEDAVFHLVLARGMGVISVGQGLLKSPDEYGLLLLSGSLCDFFLLMGGEREGGVERAEGQESSR